MVFFDEKKKIEFRQSEQKIDFHHHFELRYLFEYDFLNSYKQYIREFFRLSVSVLEIVTYLIFCGIITTTHVHKRGNRIFEIFLTTFAVVCGEYFIESFFVHIFCMIFCPNKEKKIK